VGYFGRGQTFLTWRGGALPRSLIPKFLSSKESPKEYSKAITKLPLQSSRLSEVEMINSGNLSIYKPNVNVTVYATNGRL
jgi:hypothetical protein